MSEGDGAIENHFRTDLGENNDGMKRVERLGTGYPSILVSLSQNPV